MKSLIKPALLGILFLLFTVKLGAQEITVIDKNRQSAIPGVAIFNQEKTVSVLTDFDGKADISAFSPNEVLIFRHVSHLEFQSTKKELRQQNYKVYLLPDDNELEEIVLSVSKFAREKEELPRQVVSVSSREILFSNPQTAADLLQNTGNVFVQKSQMGGGSPMVRGFSANRLLITVDGVRMNNAIFRSGNLQNVISIDPLSVERAEIILGPGAVVFGSDAVGGVMNFYTLTPEFSLDKETSFSGSILSRFSTASNEQTFHTDFNLGRRNWAFLTSLTFSDYGDLKMGRHGPREYLRNEYVVRIDGEDRMLGNENNLLQKPTGYNQLNLMEKIRFMPNGNWDFNLNFIYSTTSDFPRYDRLYQKEDNGVLSSAEWYYGPQSWFMSNFKIDKKGNGILYNNAKLTAAYQRFEESRFNRDFNEDFLFNSEENVDAYSFNLDFEKVLGKNQLYYGAEYVLNNISSEGKRTNIVSEAETPDIPRYPDGSFWQSIAAYTSFQWELHPKLKMNTGARYNHILLNAEFDDELYSFPFKDADISTGALTGSMGLSWNQAKGLNWKLNFSTAFRAPNIDDVGKVFDSEPGAVVVPNPDLKPEYAYNGELGMDWKISEAFKFEAASFYTYLDNALVRRNFDLYGETTILYQGEPSRVQALQNAASAYVYGFEGGFEAEFSNTLLLTSTFTITEGKEEQEDGTTAPLRHAAPMFGKTRLVWEKYKLKLVLFAEYNGEFNYEDLAPSEQGKAYLYAIDRNGNPYSPSWYTLNLTGRYRLSNSVNATLSLENITDQRYRTYSSGIAAAGRNLIIALRYSL